MACGAGFVWINANVASEEELCDLQRLALVLFEQQQVACVLGFVRGSPAAAPGAQRDFSSSIGYGGGWVEG
ncbi:hypothetical protein NQZ68_039153 [Dissostichus eleginoides]|nr:hypothetical protein NQZ68_039153 [Dissostichus eleginoides]